MNIAIIGCGLIGKKRALALGSHNLLIAVDVSLERAKEVAEIGNSPSVSRDYFDAINNKDVDIVIIAVTNESLSQITLDAVTTGKHVIVEKPAARNCLELDPVIKTAKKNKVFVKVGFNHRFHPALKKAKELAEAGVIGPLMFIRGRYGHGGRLGYEKEWRANAEKSGGGELIDQGVHLIDLCRWFLGEFTSVEGFVHTYFWDMEADDNAFMNLRTGSDQTAWLHVSCTEWQNMFSFEIFGQNGKLHVEGLGGSYGVEKLYLAEMLPEMGPPKTTIWQYPFPDDSWKLELKELVQAIKENKEPDGNLIDAYKALKIVEKIYKQNQLAF